MNGTGGDLVDDDKSSVRSDSAGPDYTGRNDEDPTIDDIENDADRA
jgi:hypothetical protein